MIDIQILDNLSSRQAYGIAAVMFLLVPVVLAGAASAVMHKGAGAKFNWRG